MVNFKKSRILYYCILWTIFLALAFSCCTFSSRNKKSSTDVANSLHIAPEITLLCKVQKHTVPFHMFLPVRLGLYPFFFRTYRDFKEWSAFIQAMDELLRLEVYLKLIAIKPWSLTANAKEYLENWLVTADCISNMIEFQANAQRIFNFQLIMVFHLITGKSIQLRIDHWNSGIHKCSNQSSKLITLLYYSTEHLPFMLFYDLK